MTSWGAGLVGTFTHRYAATQLRSSTRCAPRRSRHHGARLGAHPAAPDQKNHRHAAWPFRSLAPLAKVCSVIILRGFCMQSSRLLVALSVLVVGLLAASCGDSASTAQFG